MPDNKAMQTNLCKTLVTYKKALSLFLLTSSLIVTNVYAQTASQVKDNPSNASKNTLSAEQILHTSLVLTALQLDFYNERCRGISVAKNFNKVNRLYITKYSLTANNYIKLYINPDVRKEKAQHETAFKKNLNAIGGCSNAKKQGWIKALNEQFNKKYDQAELSAWFPEEN
ncbi:MAG TPA: hypothetical protein ENK73_07690 [Thiomicrospira sp.]|jgi:cellobiose-specific phosphotransferase system component IIB|nr:hypothetical protein [Thiomicrospira sp.]